jgi:hypothetical protein
MDPKLDPAFDIKIEPKFVQVILDPNSEEYIVRKINP